MQPTASPVPKSLNEFQRQRLRESADRDQARRLVHGFYAYPLIMLVLALTTRSFHEHPRLLWGTTALGALALLIRLVLILRREVIYRASPKRWRLLQAVAVVLSASAGGILYGGVIYRYGYES